MVVHYDYVYAHLFIIASKFGFVTGCFAGRIFQIVNIVPNLIK